MSVMAVAAVVWRVCPDAVRAQTGHLSLRPARAGRPGGGHAEHQPGRAREFDAAEADTLKGDGVEGDGQR